MPREQGHQHQNADDGQPFAHERADPARGQGLAPQHAGEIDAAGHDEKIQIDQNGHTQPAGPARGQLPRQGGAPVDEIQQQRTDHDEMAHQSQMAEPVQQRGRRQRQHAGRGRRQQRALAKLDDQQHRAHGRQDEACGDPNSVRAERMAGQTAGELAQQRRDRDRIEEDDVGAGRCPEVGHEKHRHVPGRREEPQVADLRVQDVGAFVDIGGVHQPGTTRIVPERTKPEKKFRLEDRCKIGSGNEKGNYQQEKRRAFTVKTGNQPENKRATRRREGIVHETALALSVLCRAAWNVKGRAASSIAPGLPCRGVK